jgi:hypothetical protein
MLWYFHFEKFCAVSSPARFGNFDHAYVVKRALFRIEIRIFPKCREQWIADGVGVTGVGNVDGTAD